MGKPSKLKALKTTENELLKAQEKIESQMLVLLNQKTQVLSQLDSVRDKITGMSKVKPQISEHAVLRYLERVKGIDIQQIQNEIWTDKADEYFAQMNENGIAANMKIKLSEFTIVVRDSVVVTVETKE